MKHISASTCALLALVSLAAAQGPADRGRELMQKEDYKAAAEALAGATVANPFDGQAWSDLGYSLHMEKRYEEAIPAYRKAVDLGVRPPTNLYNIACATALLGNTDEALSWLEKALKARFADQQTLENDTDLDSLRADPRFAALTGITRGLDRTVAATREEGWAWDLDFLIRRMEQLHWNLYEHVSAPRFRAEIEQFKARAATFTDSQMRLELRRIVALVGDGHSGVRLAAEGEQTTPRLPLHFFIFKDGMHVLGADKAHADLVGARVLKFGPLTAEAAAEAVKPYISVDNQMGYAAGAPTLLLSPVALAAIGAAEDESGVQLTLRTGGGERTVRVEPVPTPAGGHGGLFTPGFVYAHESVPGPAPLYLRRPEQRNWVEYVPEHKLVYFCFRGVVNAPHAPLKEVVSEVFDAIEKNQAEHLVIDMRFNGGGNTGLIQPLLHGLIASERINRKGHLWVIIGRHTFSAAQNTVNFIEKNTGAIFVGEPTGSRPQFVGESTWFVLPNSKTRVTCSSRYWQYMDSTDERTWVPPAIAAEMSFEAYSRNRDPAMEAVLKAIGTANP